jgi:hypothetical protein
VERDAAAERLDAIFEADETGAAGNIRAASSIVLDADAHDAGTVNYEDVDAGGIGVLRCVRERLGHDVVGSELDLFREARIDSDVEAHRQIGPSRQTRERANESALGERGRVNAVRDLAQYLTPF